MADGLDFDALAKAQSTQPPTRAGTGLDFDALAKQATPAPGASPAQGLDFSTLMPNPNLDFPDKMTPGIYARNVLRSLASGVEPVSRFFVNEAKGIGRAIGSSIAGLGTVGENMLSGTIPFMPYNYATFSQMKSLGSRFAEFNQLEKSSDGSWFTEDLPYAIGSAVPYVVAGLAGGGSAAVGLGMLDMGQSMYEDAKQHGASESDAKLAFLAGSAIGASEALPVGYLLRKINQLSGGSFYELAKGLQGAGALKEAVKGFLLGGSTEAGQEIAQNWVAKDLIGYDPTRTLRENAWDSFITGGAVGSLLMGSMGAIQTATRRDAEEKLKKQFEAALASGDPINAIAGLFTPIRNIPELREQYRQVTDELTEAGQEALNNPTEMVPGSFVSQESQGAQVHPATEKIVNAFEAIFSPTKVDNDVEKLILKEGEESLTLGEALDRTPVVVTEINPYKESIQAYEEALAKLKKLPPEEAEQQARYEGKSVEQIRSNLEEKLKILKRKQALTKIFARHMKDYVGAFMDVLGDGTKVVLGDFTGRESVWGRGVKPPRTGGETYGLIGTFRSVRKNKEGKLEDVIVVEIDFDAFATARYKEEIAKKPWYSMEETRAARQHFFEVLNHELGHYLIIKRLGELRIQGMTQGPNKDGTPNENTLIVAALENDYRKWLQKMRKSQFYEYLENVGTPNYQPREDEGSNYTFDIPAAARDYLFSFDEYYAQQVARLATQGKLAGEGIITKFFKPVLKQYEQIFKRLPYFAKNEYGSLEKFIKRMSLQHQISEEIQSANAGGPKTFYDALKKLPGFNPENFAGLQDHLDRWHWVMEYGYNILQIERANPHIEGLRNYVTIARAWASYSRAIDARAMETLAEWKRLGKKKIKAVADVLFEETENQKRLDAVELRKRLPDLDSQKVYAQIRADFDFVLDEMKRTSIEQVKKNHPDNEELQKTKIKEIEDEFSAMKKKGYFPYMRFGKWTLVVRDAEGNLVSREHFDTKRERDKATAEAKRKMPKDYRISPSIMKDTHFVVQGLPAAMLRLMKERIPGLTEEQHTAIDEALQEWAPFKGLKQHFLRRKGSAGFSLDAMRSYANYMRMSAGHLSRVKYGDEFVAAIAKVDNDAKTLGLLGRDATKRQQIANWMKGHHDYIMNPESEWTGLRGAIFQWFLGFNLKSAAVNLTQVPMITFPYLAARYGDIAAARALANANATVVSYWKNREKWAKDPPQSQRGRILRLLEQGKKDGWLDQALATELALASSEGNIQRTVATGMKRAYYKYSEWGSKPFALAEKFNRAITAIATYNLEYARTGSHTDAYNAARDAVDRTQYENSRWNRPRFMRGKMGTAFVFLNYVQNTLHFMSGGDKGALRAWMMFFLGAGLLGLPGAENAEDLVDFVATKTRELFGVKDPKFALRQELRETLQDMHLNPDLFLHGASRSSFGLGALGEMTGMPLPEFDLSGSLSLGRPLPLTSMLNTPPKGSQEVIGQAVTEVSGAGAAAFDSFLQGIWSRDPDQWKRTEKMLPVWMKNVSKSARLLARGQETSASGDVIAEFDPQDPKDLIEALGQSLGFTPTKLSEGWERTIAQRESVNYYRMRMEGILKSHNWAMWHKDADAAHEVRQRIKEFNDVVPYPEMKIGPETIKSSWDSYALARKKAEEGIENQKRYIRLRRSVEEAYNQLPAEGTQGRE